MLPDAHVSHGLRTHNGTPAQRLPPRVCVFSCRLVKRGMHGTRMMSWQEIREQYGREVVNLRNEGRWVFLNTLFSVSEAVMYMQLVDRLDQVGVGPGLQGQWE